MTPNYCHDVLKSVTDQIYSVYEVFNKVFPDFASRGGKCSLLGHSLGSVICWDLLSLKKRDLAKKGNAHHADHLRASDTASNAANIGLQQTNSSPTHSEVEVEAVRTNTDNDFGGGAWGPSLAQDYDAVIPFEPEFTMFVGSPIGLFLSLRGSHAAFDSIRDIHPQKPKISPFTLPSRAVYNIFSPSDPVAYRIEPLLLEHGTNNDSLPEPMYLTRLGEDVRLHVKALQLVSFFTGNSKRSSKVEETPRTVEKSDSDEMEIDGPTNSDGSDNDALRFPLGGKSERLDFVSTIDAHFRHFILLIRQPLMLLFLLPYSNSSPVSSTMNTSKP